MSKILGYEMGILIVDHGREFTNASMKIAAVRHNKKKLDLRDPVVLVCYDEKGCFVDVELQKRKVILFFNCKIKVRRDGPRIIITIDNQAAFTVEAPLESILFNGEKTPLREKKNFHYRRESAVDTCYLELVLREKNLKIPFRSYLEFHLHQVEEGKKGMKFPDPTGIAYNYLDAYFLQDMGVIPLHPVTGKQWPLVTLSHEQAKKLQEDRLTQLESQWQKDCGC